MVSRNILKNHTKKRDGEAETKMMRDLHRSLDQGLESSPDGTEAEGARLLMISLKAEMRAALTRREEA